MPLIEQFRSSEYYYSVLFHELVHSTGHSSRLNRETVTTKQGFGTKQYGVEELIAEMGSNFLCSETGIETTFDNSIAYIKGWIKKIREDSKIVFKAASLAEKSVGYILKK